MAVFSQTKRIETFFSLSRKAFRRYKWQIFALAVIGLIGGLLEGLGVNSLIPLLSFAIEQPVAELDTINQIIRQFFSAIHIPFAIWSLLGFIALLFVLRAGTSVILHFIRISITSDYEEQTRKKLFRSILSSNWSHLVHQKLGHLETVLMIDVPASSNLLNQFSNSLITGTSLLIYLIIALNIDVTITFLTLLTGAVAAFVLKPLMRRTKVYAHERTLINRETAHHVGENIYGIKTVKTMLAENKVAEKANKYFGRLRALLLRAGMTKAIAKSFIQPIGILYLVGIFVFFIFGSENPGLMLVKLAPIVYLTQRIFIYIEQLQESMHTAFDHIPHLKSVLSYESEAEKNVETSAGTKPFVFKKSLEFENVNFSYHEETPVLRDINFKIKKSEMLGIIGPSGVGKTTLVDIVLRLLRPTGGNILLDSKNIEEIEMSEWRKKIGYVSQDIFLMNDTIGNNIKFYDESISDENIREASELANIGEFIRNSPRGFDTQIGERGLLLSAGQRQRVVIARILARKPEILILDEATSALDNESEAKIQKMIHGLKGRMTVIAIAHRLSTIMDSDRLIVLENGRVAETGTPRELLADKDSYFFKVHNIVDAKA